MQRNKTGETRRNERQGEVQTSDKEGGSNSTQPRKKANGSKTTRSSTQHLFPRRPGNIFHMPLSTRHLAESLHRRGGRGEDGPSLGLKDREARRGEDAPREPLNFMNSHIPKGDMTPTRLHSRPSMLQDGYSLGWGYRQGTVRTGQNNRQKGTRRRE
jgi:hypothetical protein